MGQQAQRVNEPQGFAGLDALVSDITQDIAAAEGFTNQRSSRPTSQSKAVRPETSTERGQNQQYHDLKNTSSPPRTSEVTRLFCIIAGTAFLIGLIAKAVVTEHPSASSDGVRDESEHWWEAPLASESERWREAPLARDPPPNPKTSSQVNLTPSSPYRGFIPVEMDPMVMDVQQRLNELGYDAGSVDGIMGPRTRAAIESFQRDNGFVVDGVANDILVGRVNAALSVEKFTFEPLTAEEIAAIPRGYVLESPSYSSSSSVAPNGASPPNEPNTRGDLVDRVFGEAESLPSVPNEPTSRKDLIDPVFGDNDYPWPAVASYMPGHEQLNTDGYSSVTIDNSRNDSNVFVKLFARSGANDYPVRVFFVPARGSFHVANVRAGTYDIRYRDLNTGSLSKSEPFVLRETRTVDGVQYDDMTMTLYKVTHGNTQMYGISEAEF